MVKVRALERVVINGRNTGARVKEILMTLQVLTRVIMLITKTSMETGDAYRQIGYGVRREDD